MTRTRRILHHAMTLVAVASGIVTISLLIRSYFIQDQWANYRYIVTSSKVHLTSADVQIDYGVFFINWTSNVTSSPQEIARWQAEGASMQVEDPSIIPVGVHYRSLNPAQPLLLRHQLAGFKWERRTVSRAGWTSNDIEIALPLWTGMLPLVVWVGHQWRRRLKARRLLNSGRCLNCGYDLRASFDRCPECGRETTAKSDKPIPQSNTIPQWDDANE